MEKEGGNEPRQPIEPVVRAAFARVLHELRKEAKMSRDKVADASGYTKNYIELLEKRKHTPSLTAMLQISKALKVSPDVTLKRVLALMPKFAHLEGVPPI